MEERLEFIKGERRSYPRRRVSYPIVVQSTEDSTRGTKAVSENLSSSGMLLWLDSPMTLGSTVVLLFDMPTQVGDNYYPVRCLGKIVRVEPYSERYAVAVAFQKVEVVAQS